MQDWSSKQAACNSSRSRIDCWTHLTCHTKSGARTVVPSPLTRAACAPKHFQNVRRSYYNNRSSAGVVEVTQRSRQATKNLLKRHPWARSLARNLLILQHPHYGSAFSRPGFAYIQTSIVSASTLGLRVACIPASSKPTTAVSAPTRGQPIGSRRDTHPNIINLSEPGMACIQASSMNRCSTPGDAE